MLPKPMARVAPGSIFFVAPGYHQQHLLWLAALGMALLLHKLLLQQTEARAYVREEVSIIACMRVRVRILKYPRAV